MKTLFRLNFLWKNEIGLKAAIYSTTKYAIKLINEIYFTRKIGMINLKSHAINLIIKIYFSFIYPGHLNLNFSNVHTCNFKVII